MASDNDLQAALAECNRLRAENDKLRASIEKLTGTAQPIPAIPSASIFVRQEQLLIDAQNCSVTAKSSAQEKIVLFRSLFAGRQDIFALRWEAANGRSSYSPACCHEWQRAFCQKPKVKCRDCKHREFRPLDDKVINDHLTGKHTVGIYPLLPDDRCRLLAVDFDKAHWQDDVAAFLQACATLNIDATLERSRSGNGAHVWIFFAGPVLATQARALGSTILTYTLAGRYEVGLDSYDRFFPNQDTLPKGGFGNLIALPLQHQPRQAGNSLFLDPRTMAPWPDQWAYLAQVQKLPVQTVENLVADASRKGYIISVPVSLTDEQSADVDPWVSSSVQRKSEPPVTGPLPASVPVVCSNLVYVPKADLPSALLGRIIRLAAFQNPEFYKAQKARLPIFKLPRVICCAEEHPRHIALPRGCLTDLLSLLQAHNIKPDIINQLQEGERIRATFQGRLRPLQEKAVQAVLTHNTGILACATAFGKTVVAANIIATRGINTLILVHRAALLEQWRHRLCSYLDLAPEQVGQIGDGKNKPTGIVDIATIQSLYNKEDLPALVERYGHVIVDECHHLPAFSFEQVMKHMKARYILGLTATPIRRDGHHPIIVMQCGPICFRVAAKEQAASDSLTRIVIPRHTQFVVPAEVTEDVIQDVYTALTRDNERNNLILQDICAAIAAGATPLVLTDRTEHVDCLAQLLQDKLANVITLQGRMSKAKRRAATTRLEVIPPDEKRVVVATGKFVGEGFDDPRLDTLFLVSPLAFHGTLEQYTGRLHRDYEEKRLVMVYDYVDVNVPVLQRMYRKRQKSYRALGYLVQEAGHTFIAATFPDTCDRICLKHDV